MNCPRCHQIIDSQAVSCPHCQQQIKAFGHPGINLYQAEPGEFLCDRCLYHEDDSCNFPQRPYAKSCTLYHDQTLPLTEEFVYPQSGSGFTLILNWLRANRVLVTIFLLVLISFVIAAS